MITPRPNAKTSSLKVAIQSLTSITPKRDPLKEDRLLIALLSTFQQTICEWFLHEHSDGLTSITVGFGLRRRFLLSNEKGQPAFWMGLIDAIDFVRERGGPGAHISVYLSNKRNST
jgi:hypothetical protein